MKKREIEKALGSDNPINSMYSLIPEKKIKAFKKFAAIFGYGEERIKNILDNEKK